MYFFLQRYSGLLCARALNCTLLYRFSYIVQSPHLEISETGTVQLLIFSFPHMTVVRMPVSKHRYSSTDREVLEGLRTFHWLVSSLPGASSVPEDSFEIHGKIPVVLKVTNDVQAFPANRRNSQ